jgi:hypothetical protein
MIYLFWVCGDGKGAVGKASVAVDVNRYAFNAQKHGF